MRSFGQLLEGLVPAGEGEHQPKILDVLTDDGQKLGTATLFFAGPDANFHGRLVGPEFAVVGQLSITDEAAAQSQTAWMSDTAETMEGVTRVSAISPGCIIAVPLRCLRLAAEPPVMPCHQSTGQRDDHPSAVLGTELHGLSTSGAAVVGISGTPCISRIAQPVCTHCSHTCCAQKSSLMLVQAGIAQVSQLRRVSSLRMAQSHHSNYL